MSIESYLEAVPKVELHVHLEGSIQPATLLQLAKRNGVTLPADSVEGLRQWFQYSDFQHFIQVYVGITRCLRHAADYELITYELGREMARQNVRYAEVTFSPKTHDWLGVGFGTYFQGLCDGRKRAREDFGVEIRWVFDIVRLADDRERNSQYALQAALDGMNDGVVALGLGGDEAKNPPEPFAPWFEKALEAGLHSVPHAGETAGPASIWSAIKLLGAERIGHGVRAIEDPELVAYLAEHKIPLEISPTSNICIGVYKSLAEHPLRRLHDAGVTVTVNSDDPPLFNTTMNQEVALLHSEFGFDVGQIDEILLNAVRESFLPESEKRAMEKEFRSEMANLKKIHLAKSISG